MKFTTTTRLKVKRALVSVAEPRPREEMQEAACRSFSTTNQDYGSFYFGRCQYGHTDPKEIAFELAINDQVRHERCQLPSIAYDIMFNVRLSLIGRGSAVRYWTYV